MSETEQAYDLNLCISGFKTPAARFVFFDALTHVLMFSELQIEEINGPHVDKPEPDDAK